MKLRNGFRKTKCKSGTSSSLYQLGLDRNFCACALQLKRLRLRCPTGANECRTLTHKMRCKHTNDVKFKTYATEKLCKKILQSQKIDFNSVYFTTEVISGHCTKHSSLFKLKRDLLHTP